MLAGSSPSFIVTSRRRLRAPDEWSFDEPQAQELFGDVDKLVEAMRASTVGLEIDPRVQAVIHRASEVGAANDGDDVDDENSTDDDEAGHINEDDEGHRAAKALRAAGSSKLE